MIKEIIVKFLAVYTIIGLIEELILFAFYSAAILAAQGDPVTSAKLLYNFIYQVFYPDLTQFFLSVIITAYLIFKSTQNGD